MSNEPDPHDDSNSAIIVVVAFALIGYLSLVLGGSCQ